MSEIVAGRYARALYREASDKGALAEVLAGLRYLRDLNAQSPEFKAFIENPLLAYTEQTKVLHAMFDGKLPQLVITFLDLVASKRRLDILMPMVKVFEANYREAHGEIIMKVISAHPLDDAFKKQLSERIAGITGKKVIGEYGVDKSIIGGIRVWAAGKLYEYSFNNELQDYKRKALQNV